MTTFNKNKNSLKSEMNHLQSEFHAYTALEIPRDTKTPIQQKRVLMNQIRNLIESIKTDDFGIHVVVMKSKR